MIVRVESFDWGVLRISIHVAGVQTTVCADRELGIHHVAVYRTAWNDDGAPNPVVGHLEIHVRTGRVVLAAAFGRERHAGGAGGVFISGRCKVWPEGVGVGSSERHHSGFPVFSGAVS